MSRLFSLVGLFFMLVGCGEKRQRAVPPEGETSTTQGREQVPTGEASAFPIYDFESFEPLLHQGDGKIHIINFWATWCKPCLEEMPHFERIHAEYRDKGVVVVLVSLDMPNMWKSRLEPYVERKGIKSRVVILDDPQQHDWIPKVSPQWGGGIPATLIYNQERRTFHERGFTYGELVAEIEKFNL